MSNLQVTNYGICGECRWHIKGWGKDDWICGNDASDYYTDQTDYTDTCELTITKCLYGLYRT